MDGSYGEGGGQILRTAVCFSIALGVPIHVTNIRSGRRVPGLRPQHSATINILGELSSAKVEGGGVGSTDLRFSPGRLDSAPRRFDTTTAASIPLVLQAVIPAVSLAGFSLSLELVGGTDVPWSPTSDYLGAVVAPAMRAVGIGFTYRVERRGYYPVGGGKATVQIEPCPKVKPLRLESEMSGEARVAVVSRCGGLPSSVAERQADAAAAALSSRGVVVEEKLVSVEDSASQGTSVLVHLVDEGCYLGGDAVGARGKRAERVGLEAVENLAEGLTSRARVDVHLADMIAPILCLSDSPSALLIPRHTPHLTTSLHVAEMFTGASHRIKPVGRASMLSISPR